MKVNLGSGDKYKDGWVNVDLYAKRADVKKDLREVAFPVESVGRILLIHTIEHLSKDDAIDLLKRSFYWLTPGGQIEIETPDKGKCYSLICNGRGVEGAKGLFGGRSERKSEWAEWLKSWVEMDRLHTKTELPERWAVEGEVHLYVWEWTELMGEMFRIGYDTKIETPQHHGKRHKRDIRIVGTKPCE